MTRHEKASRSGSLSVEDWVRAARQAIAEGGVGAVGVEPLARRLGVTKGSFYWHFSNRDALLKATLEHWETESTGAVIAALDQIANPQERLRQLVAVAFADDPVVEHASSREISLTHMFELAVSDAANDPIVQPVLRRVSGRRVDYLEGCYRALGFSPDEARYRALLAYAVFLGTPRLAREAPGRTPQGENFQAYRQHLIATLVPEDTTEDSGEN